MRTDEFIAEKTSPINQYRALIDSGSLVDDAEQRFVVEKLTMLWQRASKPDDTKRGFARALFGWGREKVTHEALQGLYIYGSVGRGKSMLMQIFVEAIGDQAWRIHFHEFMREVHHKLDDARAQNANDPIEAVSGKIASQYRMLCLDEMQVENIADAMILGRLFEGLFKLGVILVTTSNRHPTDLYKGGLNRNRFEPFIEIIQEQCEVICLDGGMDYRKSDMGHGHYFAPLNQQTASKIDMIWDGLGQKNGEKSIQIGKRKWQFENAKNGAVRVDFKDVCEKARGAHDYQALADNFNTVIIENIPMMTKDKTSPAARFVTLIDVLYEAGTKIYLSLEKPIDQLHDDENTRFVFDRTLSRLNEMASEKWNASS